MNSDAVNGSAKFRQNLISVITEAKADQGCTKGQGTLLNATASKVHKKEHHYGLHSLHNL